MQIDSVEVRAIPVFDRARCPKCRHDMLELSNGFFSVIWYCNCCKAPYRLKMMKMTKFNEENLKLAIEEASKQ